MPPMSSNGAGLDAFPVRHVTNRHAARPDRGHVTLDYGPDERAVLSLEGFEAARNEIASWPGYAPTPFPALPGLARRLGLASLRYKDEGQRFGLKSFKALGGAYAVLAVLKERLAADGAGEVRAADFASGRWREQTRDVTVAAATDGNHGRSVAWGARMFGCACVIYLHAHVSAAREREIAAFGAKIVRVAGHYDDSVKQCAKDAEANGWALVADTSDDPAAPMPALVMQGYTLIAEEMLESLPTRERLTHLFVPAGVGGLAAALAAHFWERLGSDRPRLVVVEPVKADCVFRSIVAGAPTSVPGGTDTFMACLAAAEVSLPAWAVMRRGVDDVLALPDEAAAAAMRLLADAPFGDPVLVAGESGAAALAGLVSACADPTVRAALGLDAASRVAVIGSEGATDRDAYLAAVGRPAEQVAA